MAFHVLSGEAAAYDDVVAYWRNGGLLDRWVVPGKAVTGDDIVFYFKHLDRFVALGKVESTPQRSMFGAQSVFRAKVSVSNVFAPPIPLADVAALAPQWKWPHSASKSKTTPVPDIATRLLAFFIEKSNCGSENDHDLIWNRLEREGKEIVLATYTQERISEWTGFDYFEEFQDAAAVRAYFTVSNLQRLYEKYDWSDDYEYPTEALVLRTCADVVILNGWHMVQIRRGRKR